MLVYHRLGDIVLRLGMHAAMFRVTSLFGAGTRATVLIPLQRHLLGVDGFAVREGVESLSSFCRQLCSFPDHARRVVGSSARDVVASLVALKGLERVLVPAKRKIEERFARTMGGGRMENSIGLIVIPELTSFNKEL